MFMLNSAEQEICPFLLNIAEHENFSANKYVNAKDLPSVLGHLKSLPDLLKFEKSLFHYLLMCLECCYSSQVLQTTSSLSITHAEVSDSRP